MSKTIKSTESLSDFKRRLAISVVLLNFLVFSIAGIALYQSRINYEKKAAILTQNIAMVLNQQIKGEINSIDMALVAVKYEAEAQIARGGIDKDNLNTYMNRQLSYLPSIQGLRLTNSRGDVIYGTSDLKQGVNVVDRDYFIFGRNNPRSALFIARPVKGRESGKWVMNVARRVNNPDGTFAGTAFGIISLDHFTTIFSGVNVGKKGSLTLRDGDLALIARYPDLGNSIGSKAVSKEFAANYRAGITNATFKGVAGIDKTERFITYRKIPDYPLVVVVALGVEEYLDEWHKDSFAQLGLVVLFTITTIISSWILLARWKLEKKAEAELRTAKEELELRVEQRTVDLNQANEQLKNELVERKLAEKKIRDVTNYIQTILQTSPVGFFTYKATGEAVSMNESAARIVGTTIENLERQNFRSLESWKKFGLLERADSALATGVSQRGDLYIVTTYGNAVELDCLFVPFVFGEEQHLMLVALDITERKHAEEERQMLEKQLLHAQKLESLGVLAGGIAHDFNNILMAIMGNAEIARMRIDKGSPAIKNLQNIEQASVQAADLAKQMLAYSGKGKFIIEHLDMNYLLEEMLHMLEISISKMAVLRLNLASSLPSIEADAAQIRQVIMNLVINASEAIGEKSGEISIRTGCITCDKSYLKNNWNDKDIHEGLYVFLEITDTGCGMAEETLNKIFDPFFSTKFTGRGLGMAAVLGIVRSHKGTIKVYSEQQKGTTFNLLFPACGRPVEILNSETRQDEWKGEGKVLLVDDEESVRCIGSEMLTELGFTTITANNGRDAVEIFKANPDFTLVILDLTMPHMDGEQCFDELREIKPDVKVIISSGYNEQEATQKFVGKELAGFIQKPYKLSALKETIKRIPVFGE